MGLLPNTKYDYQTCIDQCNKCAQACYECFNTCLKEPDVHQRINCLSLLIECAKSCQMSAGTMAMDGKLIKDHCKMCAELCNMCAQDCSLFKDDHCTECAKICRDCAKECDKMAN